MKDSWGGGEKTHKGVFGSVEAVTYEMVWASNSPC